MSARARIAVTPHLETQAKEEGEKNNSITPRGGHHMRAVLEMQASHRRRSTEHALVRLQCRARSTEMGSNPQRLA
jgi:hypothetical protein